MLYRQVFTDVQREWLTLVGLKSRSGSRSYTAQKQDEEQLPWLLVGNYYKTRFNGKTKERTYFTMNENPAAGVERGATLFLVQKNINECGTVFGFLPRRINSMYRVREVLCGQGDWVWDDGWRVEMGGSSQILGQYDIFLFQHIVVLIKQPFIFKLI